MYGSDTLGKKEYSKLHFIKTNENGLTKLVDILESDLHLTIESFEKETVTIIAQVIGAGTHFMKNMKKGDYFVDFVGPLGKASELIETPIEEFLAFQR